ncbi:MAG: ABC transporter permease [Mediterranea massiliensis]|nr:ABC transporter permease [Mediterranea massiliensis]
MIKKTINQAFVQLRQSPLISSINVVGTALAIFLIMLVVMLQQVKTAPFSPESNRDRFLHVRATSIENKEWGAGNSSNGPMSVQTAKELYQSLKTPEAVTIYVCQTLPTPVSLPGQAATTVDVLQTDDAFWRVFDFRFLEGKPYDKATFDAAIPVAVVSETTARLLFGTAKNVVGKEFLLNHAPYRVGGIVKDVSTLANIAYGQVWIPYTAGGMDKETWNSNHLGMMSCTILAKEREDFPAIREECDRRLEEYNKVIGENGWKIFSRNRPYDQEKNSISFATNWEPDLPGHRRQQFIIFLILLIVPAINISSMTQSRLRQRVSEIGVRRAFGSTRMELMMQIVSENFVVTLIAGVLGLLLSVAFAYVGNDFLFAQPFSPTLNPPEVDASILLQLDTFLWALFFCFVLNLLSSGIPAWRASRIGIVSALSGRLN